MSLKAFYTNALILFTLVLFSFGSAAQAQESIDVVIPDNLTAPPGTTTFLVPVNVTHNNPSSRIVAYNFAVYFNQNAIAPCVVPYRVQGTKSEFNINTGEQNFAINDDTNTPGRIGIAAAAGTQNPAVAGFQGSGVLIYLCFNVVGTANNPANCCTAINFSTSTTGETEATRFNSFGGTQIPFTQNSGSFFVQGTTAASVNLSGRVLTAQGRGLRGAQVRLTLADGTTRTVMSSSFGYYRFTNLQAGQTVTVQIVSKKYGSQAHTVNLTGDVSDLDFVAGR